MKKFLLFVLVCISFQGFAQESWYKVLAGTIDKFPITMHVHKAGHEYTGYYYYDARQEPIFFSGEDSSVKEKIQLVAYTDPVEAEFFSFAFSGGKAVGNWKHTKKSKAVSFTAAEIKMPVEFFYVYTKGKTKLRPKLKNSPEASYMAQSVWPAGNTATDSFLKKMIRKEFSEEKSKDDIGKIFIDQKKDFFKNYIEGNKDEMDKNVLESGMYSYETFDNMMVVFQSTRMLSFAHSNNSYTGGAHGMDGTYYLSVDLINKKQIMLEDVLNKEGIKKLNGLLEKNFRIQYKLKPTDPLSEGGLFEDKIAPNKNFYLTAKGIGFAYNPYEIGPYVMGQIHIFIPFKELENYFQPGFKNLIR